MEDQPIVFDYGGHPSIEFKPCTYETKEIRAEIYDLFKKNSNLDGFKLPKEYFFEWVPSRISGKVARIGRTPSNQN